MSPDIWNAVFDDLTAMCEAMIVWTVSLDEDPLMATFAVFMHTMLSAALDTSFLASIVQNEEGTDILTYIDPHLRFGPQADYTRVISAFIVLYTLKLLSNQSYWWSDYWRCSGSRSF